MQRGGLATNLKTSWQVGMLQNELKKKKFGINTLEFLAVDGQFDELKLECYEVAVRENTQPICVFVNKKILCGQNLGHSTMRYVFIIIILIDIYVFLFFCVHLDIIKELHYQVKE